MTCYIAQALLSLDIAEKLSGVPLLIGYDGNANIRGDAEDSHNGDEPGGTNTYGTLSPFQAAKDVCNADRAGEHEDWHEVTEVPRCDVSPQEQGGAGAPCRQKQESGPRHLSESSGSKGSYETPETEEEEERHRRWNA